MMIIMQLKYIIKYQPYLWLIGRMLLYHSTYIKNPSAWVCRGIMFTLFCYKIRLSVSSRLPFPKLFR